MRSRKRFILFAVLFVVLGSIAVAVVWWRSSSSEKTAAVTDKDILAFAAQHKLGYAEKYQRENSQTVQVEKIDPARRVRLAVGWLGLPDDAQNEQAGDLIVANLNAAKNLELVDRQSLDKVLREQSMKLTGLANARSAVAVGKLLRVDWFLLGSVANLKGHRYVLARIVDAHTGAVRDVTALADDAGPLPLATNLASFVVQSRNNATSLKRRTLLAIGTFRDLDRNPRAAGFADQLNAQLLARFQGVTNVTLLERECVDLLLQEIRLDLASLTDNSETNAALPMLAAMWTVNGDYQYSDTSGPHYELAMYVAQTFGDETSTTIQGAADEALFDHAKQIIDKAIVDGQQPRLRTTLATETDYQMERGNKLLGEWSRDLSTYAWNDPHDHYLPPRKTVEAAARAYRTVLLLDPENRRAKACLAICLNAFPSFGSRDLDEARGYYEELANSPVHDKLTPMAMAELGWSYLYQDDAQAEMWFRKAADVAPNDYFKETLTTQANNVADRIAARNRTDATPEDRAEDEFRSRIRELNESAKHIISHNIEGIFDEFLGAFGTNRAAGVARLNKMLPELKQKFPSLAPIMILHVFGKQIETNNPLTEDFMASLQTCADHPDQTLMQSQYFGDVSGVAIKWCSEHKQYALVPQLYATKRRALAGIKNAESAAMARRGFKVGPPLTADDIKLDGEDSIILANAYIGMERWQNALDIMHTFPSMPVATLYQEVWLNGTIPGGPSDIVGLCRQKLGLPPIPPNPRVFSLGKSVFGFQHGGSFNANADGVWIAEPDKLTLVDADFKTNLSLSMPSEGTCPAFVCPGTSNLFIATQGSGLIEYDKTNRQFRRWSQKDGLYSEMVMCLCLQGDTLWIGYDRGVGRMSLETGKFTMFSPSISTGANRGARSPIDSLNTPVASLAAGPEGDIFLTAGTTGPMRYRVREEKWEWVPWVQKAAGLAENVVCDGSTVYLAVNYFSAYEEERPNAARGDLNSLMMQDLKEGGWQQFGESASIPEPCATAVALDGKDVWLGGRGFIGVLKPEEKTMRKFCYTHATEVYHLQVAGGYVWAQEAGRLYRIPLAVAK